jgi:TMEM175 potassium channel family protein
MTFADAVVAIALTLLVLPLSDFAADIDDSKRLGDVLSEHRAELGSFVLSFVVIWLLWSIHHRMMEYFDGYDGVVIRLMLLWMFTIVVLPFVTQLVAGPLYEHGAVPLYDGVLLLSSLSLAALSWWGHRHPELLQEDSTEVRRWLAEPVSFVTPVLLLIAMVLAILNPAIGTWPLFALVIDDRIENLWLRIRGKR